MKVFLQIVLLVAFYSTVQALREAVVEFNAKGVRGTITFTELEVADGELNPPIQIVTNLDGLQGHHNWHVHELPVDQTVDPSAQCGSDWVGPHYDPFEVNTGDGYKERCENDASACEAGDLTGKFGQIPSNGQLSEVDRTGTLFLDGKYSIIGRSIVIHSHEDGANFECGTIRPVEEREGTTVTVLQATFTSPMAGTIYFKQVEEQNVQIWGRLFWVNDSPATVSHTWHIHDFLPNETYKIGVCDGIGGHYDPTDNRADVDPTYGDRCSPENVTQCEVGDLAGKHAQLDVAATPSPYKQSAFFFTDTYLNLTGTNAVADRSVALHAAEGGHHIIACAPLVQSERLTVAQYPTGYLTASQLSPFENTVFTTRDLPSNRLSILSAALSPQTNCLDDDSAATYDTTYVGFTPFSGSGENTPDKYSLGDLYNRYGDKFDNNAMFQVFDMPIYGTQVTISNRALRAEYNERRECSAFLPEIMGNDLFTAIERGDIIMAKASFYFSVVTGGIYFIQRDYGNGILGNTYIIVDIYYTDDTMSTTSGHNWHVHQDPPGPRPRECANVIGPHFNPFNVSLANTDDEMDPSTNSNYTDDCSPLYPLRCESGDLSNKHGQLQISALVRDRKTYTFVDDNLALSGEYSIIGRSIGLHLPASDGGTLFDCEEVKRVYPADDLLDLTFPLGRYLRPKVVYNLSWGNVSPGCGLILNQNSGSQEFSDGTACVTATLRALGESVDDANNNRELFDSMVAPNYNDTCTEIELPPGGAPHAVAALSLLQLLACLLVVAFY